MGGAGGAQARSAEHRRGVGIVLFCCILSAWSCGDDEACPHSPGGEKPPDPCEADPREDPGAVSDACGVFAQAEPDDVTCVLARLGGG
ncbi:hypothetical protein BE15_25420 [Sorangium cellulosum]|uniref:Uncharacterized protein n=1 Tax=Sorangium cellulosum TaxID=56 RepID=A0A150QHD2_SORCE|nr:hypothetical protein BE15_25420 [Sorangium cellulosum]